MRRVYRTDVGLQRDVRSAFTLIELLVVVAIIALLIAILLPSLANARAQAKLTVCLANLHDNGVALNIYAAEHRGYFPPTPYVGSTIEKRVTAPQNDDNLFILWYKRYARDVRTFSCPATRYSIRTPVQVNPVKTKYGTWYDIKTVVGGKIVSRNDFEYIAQWMQDKDNQYYGTSYEYNAWSDAGSRYSTIVNWYHADKIGLRENPWRARRGDGWTALTGKALKTESLRQPTPAFRIRMHDADEGADNAPLGGIIGARTTPTNNTPEPWDNHGTKAMSILFDDGHTVAAKPAELKAIWNRNDMLAGRD